MPTRSSVPTTILFDPIHTEPQHCFATVDLEQPTQGIVFEKYKLLGLDLHAACSVHDYWLRGEDVVAVYTPNDERNLRATAMWRQRHQENITSWELIASVTTNNMLGDASICIVNELDSSQIVTGFASGTTIHWKHADEDAADCVLLRHPQSERSLLIAPHPLNRDTFSIEHTKDRMLLKNFFFSAVAERGVLFRSQIIAAIGPAINDREWASHMWSKIVNTPPMLSS